MDIFWLAMAIAALMFAISSPFWWLNLIMLYVSYEYWQWAKD